jgi:hypothetical protein
MLHRRAALPLGNQGGRERLEVAERVGNVLASGSSHDHRGHVAADLDSLRRLAIAAIEDGLAGAHGDALVLRGAESDEALEYRRAASLPAEAVRLGRDALLAEYPSIPRTGRLSLFERAERIGGARRKRVGPLPDREGRGDQPTARATQGRRMGPS